MLRGLHGSRQNGQCTIGYRFVEGAPAEAVHWLMTGTPVGQSRRWLSTDGRAYYSPDAIVRWQEARGINGKL
jgi:hypothetical protein